MPDLSTASKIQARPPILDYANIGTAAGTAVLCKESCYLGKINITRRLASATFVLYDSNGTSTSLIGTIALGTQTFGDAPTTYDFDFRTVNGLTIVNLADSGALVSYGK